MSTNKKWEIIYIGEGNDHFPGLWSSLEEAQAAIDAAYEQGMRHDDPHGEMAPSPITLEKLHTKKWEAFLCKNIIGETVYILSDNYGWHSCMAILYKMSHEDWLKYRNSLEPREEKVASSQEFELLYNFEKLKNAWDNWAKHCAKISAYHS